MIRVFRHTLSQMLVNAASDQVLSGAQIPSEGKLNNVFGDVHAVATVPLPTIKSALYGCDGRVLLHQTPDDGATYNTLWDANVPKDVDVSSGAIDLNVSANAASFFEPGEPDVHAIADMAIADDDKLFYKRRQMVSFASAPRGFVSETPDSYWPADHFKVRSGKSIFVDYWSLAAVAFASPAMDDVTTTVFTTFGDESALMQLKYLEMTLEQAWIQLVGLTETGAETPWEDAANMIGDYLEPTVVEITAGDFSASQWQVMSKFTWDVSVPGRKEIRVITAN